MKSVVVPPTRVSSALVRRVVAAFLVMHGIAHLVGVQESFAAIADGDAVAYLLGAVDVRGAALGVAGVVWIVAAVAFGLAAWQVLRRRPTRRSALMVATSMSLVLSVLALPQAWIGVVINVALFGAVWLWDDLRTVG